MKLSYARIQNFRSIKDITVRFEPTCRVLVGINESGKSNILRALSLLDPTTKVGPDDIREAAPAENFSDEASVTFCFLLEPAELKERYSIAKNRILTGNPKDLLLNHGVPLSVEEFFLSYAEVVH